MKLFAHVRILALCALLIGGVLGFSLVSCATQQEASSSAVSASEEPQQVSVVDKQVTSEAEKAAKEKAEAEAKKKAEAEAKVKAEAEAEAKAKAEEEAKAKAEAEAKAKAEEEAKAAEEEAKRKAEEEAKAAEEAQQAAQQPAVQLNLAEDYRASFVHGDKGAQYQKYIMLHDTESETDAYGIVNYWDGNGTGVAAHFIVNKDGSIVQCVPLDKIAHHAGFGDAGHNAAYGVEDESRDDKVGTVPIGDWAPDYGMNSYSVGIEMVHVGGSGYYPEEQLAALDALIAYIDNYYGFQSTIIDHKAWRSGNSDTSPEFAGYLANYQDHRTHN